MRLLPLFLLLGCAEEAVVELTPLEAPSEVAGPPLDFCPYCYLSVSTGRMWVEFTGLPAQPPWMEVTFTRANGTSRSYTARVPSPTLSLELQPRTVAGVVAGQIAIPDRRGGTFTAPLLILP
jgi:hypothetical protein